MNRDDIQKLLGGYATGTLSPEERQALFEAALTDQELFDALAREEPLRDVLSDPAARAHLLAAIDNAAAPWYRQWWRPMVVIAAAVVAVVGVAVWEHSREPKLLTVAKVELPRFRPPAAVPETAAPNLPPPPEVKRAVPAMNLPPLPMAKPVPSPPPIFAAPAAAPPPPPLSQGAAISGPRMQQADQAQQSQTQGRLQNSLLAPTPVPVRGTVTDATGAAISSAQVLVKSLATGQTVNTSTDDRGQFTVPELPGSPYLVTASAPGFQTATLRDVAPATPVNLTLQVGAAAETVEVTATSGQMQPRAAVPHAGLVGGMTEMKKVQSVAAPAIAYRLLRQVPVGDPVIVPADGTVPVGSVLILRVTPPADGYLRIVNGTAAIANRKVRRGATSETTLPPFDQPGRIELQVYFSRQAGEAKDQAPQATFTFTVQ
jgi:hypothetical protein